jgi:hypothetical protein
VGAWVCSYFLPFDVSDIVITCNFILTRVQRNHVLLIIPVACVQVTELWENETFAEVFPWVHNIWRCVLPLIALVILNIRIIRRMSQRGLSRVHL